MFIQSISKIIEERDYRW